MPYGSAAIDTIESSGNLSITGNVTATGTVTVGTIQSNTTLPPIIQNSSNTEIGTFCRAWVNFDGQGVVAIRASFNVGSITDNATGNYVVNFTNSMIDANYSAVCTSEAVTNDGGSFLQAYNTGNVRVRINAAGAAYDADIISVAVFR